MTGLADGVTSLATRPSRTSTSLNRPVGSDRRLDSVTVDLEAVRSAAHASDATVNDLVLAAVSGGLRDLLLSRGEDPSHLELHALVPVSTRSDELRGALGNRVTGIVAPLPLARSTSDGRLSSVRDAMARRKSRHDAEGTELLLEGLELLPPALLAMATKSIHRQPFVNVVVTNIPGPPVPLYFMGARMLEVVPIVPLARNLSVGIAILSYDGRLTLGFFADRDLWPDLGVLTGAVQSAFDDYTASTRPTPVRTAGPSRQKTKHSVA
jgi:WS/DGAT/MGAT family acyltransferase